MSVSAIESWGARLRTPGYLILSVVAIMPLLDFVAGLWPMHLADSSWRFGAIGLFSSYAVGILAELFLMFALAVAANDRKVLVAIGTVAALLALALVASSASYALDALQTRARVTPDSFKRFDFVAVEGFVKLMLVLVSSVVLSRSAFKGSRRDGATAGRVNGTATPLVAARPSQGRQANVSDAQGQ